MFNSLARRETELYRFTPTPWKIDRKTASAAGGQRKSKTNLDEGRDELHLEKA